MLTLYHGSTVNIDRIDLTKSRPNKDFDCRLPFFLDCGRRGVCLGVHITRCTQELNDLP